MGRNSTWWVRSPRAPAPAPGPPRWPRGPGSRPGRGRFGCRTNGRQVHIRLSTPRPPRRGLSVGREVPGRARGGDGSGVGPRGHMFTSAAPRPGPRAGGSPLAARSRVGPGTRTVRVSGQGVTGSHQPPRAPAPAPGPLRWPRGPGSGPGRFECRVKGRHAAFRTRTSNALAISPYGPFSNAPCRARGPAGVRAR